MSNMNYFLLPLALYYNVHQDLLIFKCLLLLIFGSLKPKSYKKKKIAQQFSQGTSSHRGSFDRISTTSTVESRQTHTSGRGHPRSSIKERGSTEFVVKPRKTLDSASSRTSLERKAAETQLLLPS